MNWRVLAVLGDFSWNFGIYTVGFVKLRLYFLCHGHHPYSCNLSGSKLLIFSLSKTFVHIVKDSFLRTFVDQMFKPRLFGV